MSVFYRLILTGLFFLSVNPCEAVTTTYVSADDEDITIKSVVVTPGKDNVQGIFATPLSAYLRSLVERDRFWEITDTASNLDVDLDELRANAKQTTDLIKKNNSDGLLHLQLSKGSQGLRFQLGLFTKKTGFLWAYSDFLEKQKFDLEYTRSVIDNLYQQVLSQLPYQGLLLSRNGSKVTINRGALAQLRPDQELNVIQVISVKRHPQFQFVIHVEKEIIGKVRLTKIDETLSFGYILFEKEPQVIQPGLKLVFRDPVSYPKLVDSKNESIVEHLLARGDGEVMMQGDSKEWVPQNLPTFGRMHAMLGIGELDASTNLSTAGSLQSLTSMALNAQFDADFWMNQSWFIRAGINQGSAQVRNPLPDSSPNRLNFSLQSTKLALGIDLEVDENIYGPRLQALLGISQFHSTVTESNPTSFTTNEFYGTAVGLVGFMPLEENGSRWGLGAEIWYHFNPRLNEKPVDSGSAKNIHMSQISGALYYHTRPNLYWVSRLTVDAYRARFSGTGTRVGDTATSTEIYWRRIDCGIEYLF